MTKETKRISYNGEFLDTIHYKDYGDDLFKEIKQQYYTKPNLESVKNEMVGIYYGNTKMPNITNYFFKDLMAKTKIYYNKWSIEDVFNCKELLGHFLEKIECNEKVYTSKNLIDNIETAFRLGGKGVATKPANFPIKYVAMILKYYNINDNYYDFSCGWGARLLGALQSQVNYFGTDPNYLLVGRLNQMSDFYKSNIPCRSKVDIRATGSEIFHKERENTIGVAFSSPPYFYLEDYKIGNQSYKKGTSYHDWLEYYMRPTIKNVYKYLVNEGAFIININNFKEYQLVEDVCKIALSEGFYLVSAHKLENIMRIGQKNNQTKLNDNSEKIMVFKKNKDKDYNLNDDNIKLGQMDLF